MKLLYLLKCTPSFKGRQELNNLKDQLSYVIKTQLDFQQKIENQMITLQTMMQTICQLVNNDIIQNKKHERSFFFQKSNHLFRFHHLACTSRIHRDHTDFEIAEPRPNWLGSSQKLKDTHNAVDELLTFARRMNTGKLITRLYKIIFTILVDPNLNRQFLNNPLTNRHSAYIDTLEASQKLARPMSFVSASETNNDDISKQMQRSIKTNQESLSSTMSPSNIPPSYDVFESGLSTGNLSINRLRNDIFGTSNSVPSPSNVH